jgi:hypothetical protein
MVYTHSAHMQISKHWYSLLWFAPLITHSAEVQAWGLVTHIYFAHSLLWAMPLLDPRLQAIIKKFPELVMAGACLPDLAIVSKHFDGSHQWNNIYQLLKKVESEEHTAVAIGYVSHLYIDVIAHNHFVPAHEAFFKHHSILTHISAEWAMDAYLAPLVNNYPAALLKKHQRILADFTEQHFGVIPLTSNNAIRKLAFWDNLLRRTQITRCIYLLMRGFDRAISEHFMYYIARTQTALQHFGMMFEGNYPHWQPELSAKEMQTLSEWRQICLTDLRLRHPQPINYQQKKPECSKATLAEEGSF